MEVLRDSNGITMLFSFPRPTADVYPVTEACWVLRGEEGEAEEWVESTSEEVLLFRRVVCLRPLEKSVLRLLVQGCSSVCPRSGMKPIPPALDLP